MSKSNQSNPLATICAVITLTVIGSAAKHCMKKYALKQTGVKRRRYF